MTAKRSFALSALWLILLTFLVHGSALSGWWRWDDPEHLVFLMQYSAADYFFSPAVWHLISPINFTPLLNFSLGADLQLFGLHPFGFYVHHLVSLYAAAILSLLLFELWLPRRWALLAVTLFLLGTPTLAVAQQLMSRHYIEGLAFMIAALYCFVVAVRNNHAGYAWLGGFCYLLAMLCKEIYAPLIGLLPFLPEGNWRQRCRKGIPFALAALIYICWRLYMLDTPVRGYASLQAFDLMRCLRQFAVIPQFLWGHGWSDVLVILLSCAVIGVALWRHPRGLWILVVALALLLLPLAPLTIHPGLPAAEDFGQGRFLLLLWWSVSLGLMWALYAIVAANSGKPVRIGAGVFLIAAFGVAMNHAWAAHAKLRDIVALQEMHGRFVWHADDGQVLLLPPEVSQWYIQLVSSLRKLTGDIPPLFACDEIQLTALDLDTVSVSSYDPSCHCIADITAQVPSMLKSWRNRLVDRPLEVDARLDREQRQFSWHLGPYTDGQYSLVNNVVEKRVLPPQGMFELITDFDPGIIVLRYDAPDGTISYSQPLRFTEIGIEWLPEHVMRPQR